MAKMMLVLRRYSLSSPCGRLLGRAACAASSRVRLMVLIDQRQVDVLERMPRWADRQYVRSAFTRARVTSAPRRRRRTRRGRTRPHRPGASHRRRAARRWNPGRGRRDRLDHQRPLKLLVAQVVGSTDGAQRRAQNRHAVAEPLGLLQAMRGQKDGRAALAQPVDQVMHVARAAGSRPAVGSSRNSTSGSLRSALASATRCRRPLDNVPQASRTRPTRLTARNT